MTTTEELRTAMNELAAEATPLHSGDLLRDGRRYRTRRRLAVGGGTVAVVIAVVAAVNLLPVRLDTEPEPISTGPVVMETVAPDERFVFGPEIREGEGFKTKITDRVLPAHNPGETPPPPAQVDLLRWPGMTTIGPVGEDSQIRTITVSGVTVRMEEKKERNGWSRWLDWTDGTSRYLLVAQPYYYRDEVSYGPMSVDLPGIVARVIERDKGRN